MEKQVAQVETTISAPPGTVWKAMTAKQSALFPGTQVETDWQVGHAITFAGEWKGKSFKDRGEIVTVDEGKQLSFTHWSEMSGQPDRPENYHVVRYDLSEAGDGTKVVLTQLNRGDKADIDAKTKAEFEKNWTMMLDNLKTVAEGA